MTIMYYGADAGKGELPFERTVNFDTHMKVSTAAAILQMDVNKLYGLIKRRRVAAVRTPAGILIPLEAVEAERARREAYKHLLAMRSRGGDDHDAA